MDVQLIQSHDAALFAPVLREIDFGEAFTSSLHHWCARSERPADLRLWEVFLALDQTTPIGVCGWYQTTAMQSHLAWLSWLGIRQSHRRRGTGAAMLAALVRLAQATPGLTELWVYTDPAAPDVHRFYEHASFRYAGLGNSVPPHAGLDAQAKVFYLSLTKPAPCQPPLNLPRSAHA